MAISRNSMVSSCPSGSVAKKSSPVCSSTASTVTLQSASRLADTFCWDRPGPSL